jgi:tRNA (guanine-N7-)-methyltransferase
LARRRKLEKISEIKALPNVFEKPEGLKGNWNEAVFENPNPITLEIGCGRGEYTINLARKFPDKNFIGADIKGPRIWKGAKSAYEENIHNAAFVRTLVESITDYFKPEEVAEIWVTFPDPYPKPSKAQKRLVSERFLKLYKQILIKDGILHFKTDNTDLFNWAVEQFKGNPDVDLIEYTHDLYQSPLLDDVKSIKTTYEAKFLAEGETIKYARLRLR